MARNFTQMFRERQMYSALCIGLDPDPKKIGKKSPLTFLQQVVENTHKVAGAYKPNLAFYLQYGEQGISLLQMICGRIRQTDPGVPIILDMKTADIGNTSQAYASFAFDFCLVDAVTANPYLGEDALEPFLSRKDKGVFVLCRTSNPGGGWLQSQQIAYGDKIYEFVAEEVGSKWNKQGNCGLVVGATVPDELKLVRQCAPQLPILIPGVGKQGGDLEAAVRNGRDAEGGGFLINVSSDILYSSLETDFGQRAGERAVWYRDQIQRFR